MGGFDLIIKPDEDDVDVAEILVDGSLEDKPYRFLLDTGAARTSVVFDDYTSSFDSIEQHSSSGVFEAHHEDVIRVPAIDLGPIVKRDFPLVRMNPDHPSKTGLIGMDILKDFCFHFLFDQNRVSIQQPAVPVADLSWQKLFLDQKFHPYIDVHFDTLTARTVWDTGGGITIADLTFIEKHSSYFQPIGQSQGTDPTGASMETPIFMMAPTLIGGYAFPAHKIAGVDLSPVNATIEVPMDLILGYTTLCQAHWLFDFPGKRWAISQRISS
ncbi:retropepsin-like aspartic protease [Dictyobacter aurantiacus]|uniref:Peptidase A2 domain-containing protein n=1 Tax=Dictyobacter aurantiacus TaxID=1936993 RepID=A0A401ZRE2_9CHLR|nr:retropepsin-like aspartic protease [Dictyobacter aurantiacus]GCE09435.1 hypothetical protein KDAU_67640 [Dictyobacter aurantiacus]